MKPIFDTYKNEQSLSTVFVGNTDASCQKYRD